MFWKKKNNNDFTNIIGLTNTRDIDFSNSGDFWLTFSQALLCLLLCVGSICGYASCFSAEFNLATILVTLSIASIVIAYARNLKSTFLKNVIYITFLFAFAYFIMRYFRYVNSGYHAIVNMTYASLENYLEIPALVYYEELIENSYTTITIFLIFLGLFELLLFHMWIGERIHLLSLFLVSFGPYIIPLFINLFPDELYLLCLLTAYLALIMICLSLHINNHPSRKKEYTVFTTKNPWSISHKGFSYGANGFNYFLTTIVSLLLTVSIIAMVGIITPRGAFQNNLRTSKLKQSVTDDVKYIVTFGLSGYFNRYNATGGLSEGRLGGIYSVRPDYETDLEVTFVPVSYEPLYLRGFVGVGYTDRQWYGIDNLYENSYINDAVYKQLYDDIQLIDEFQYLRELNIVRNPYVITVKNIRADVDFNYTPYYCDPAAIPESDGEITNTFMYSKTRNYPFYYYMSSAQSNTYLDPSFDMSAYLQVPSATREAIINFLHENDLCTEYIMDGSLAASYTEAEITLIINQLSDCLTTDFVYSLNPGITPNKEDFVGHFLENKKGFCAHFATSAALILRTLGIPTRYVEGYVVTTDDLSEGKIAEHLNPADYADTSLVETSLSVVTAEIGDDKAHAWVEYYTPEFGWQTFEATTALSEISTNSNFWDSLYGLFREVESQRADTDLSADTNLSSGKLSTFLYRLLLILLAVIVISCLTYFAYRFTKQYRSYHRNHLNINVRNFYKIICSLVSRKYPEFLYLISYEMQLEFLNEHFKLSKSFNQNNCNRLIKILERAAFSHEEISSTEFKFAMKLLRLLRRNITFNF